MIPVDKVREIIKKHETLEKELSSGAIEKKLFASKSKEYSELNAVINNAKDYGWSHHIERLMILANIMNLCEINPKQVYKWFMEMFVDSSDWVMAPNVYGMGLFSDGGIFATKPYICGSS